MKTRILSLLLPAICLTQAAGATGTDPFTGGSPPETVITIEAQPFAADMLAPETILLTAPVGAPAAIAFTASIRWTCDATQAFFSEEEVFRLCTGTKPRSDNPSNTNHTPETACLGNTGDNQNCFSRFPEDIRKSRYRCR